MDVLALLLPVLLIVLTVGLTSVGVHAFAPVRDDR